MYLCDHFGIAVIRFGFFFNLRVHATKNFISIFFFLISKLAMAFNNNMELPKAVAQLGMAVRLLTQDDGNATTQKNVSGEFVSAFYSIFA